MSLSSDPFGTLESQEHKKEDFNAEIEVIIYVPSTDSSQKFIGRDEFKKRTSNTRDFLRHTFGGYSEIEGEGGSIEDGKKVDEQNAQVKIYTHSRTFFEKRKQLLEWLHKIRQRWGQNSIGFEIEGRFHTIV